MVDTVRDDNLESDYISDKLFGSAAVDQDIGTGWTDECSGSSGQISGGPIMTSVWGQGCVYNDDCPAKDCWGCETGRTPTGCVATAIAQVMRHHDFPADRGWSVMRDQYAPWESASPGADEISNVMYEIGLSVGTDYGCSVSSVANRP